MNGYYSILTGIHHINHYSLILINIDQHFSFSFFGVALSPARRQCEVPLVAHEAVEHILPLEVVGNWLWWLAVGDWRYLFLGSAIVLVIVIVKISTNNDDKTNDDYSNENNTDNH